VSIVHIPGNLLAEGTLFVHANMVTLDPDSFQFSAPEAIAFQVIDSLDGDSARGDWAKHLGGAVRPLLEWETQFTPNGKKEITADVEEARS
jgi:lipopolysaccharide transport system ATP-binding protein